MVKSELIQVIRTEHNTGRGIPEDPCRTVVSYHLPDGTDLAVSDPNEPNLAHVGHALAECLNEAIDEVGLHNDTASRVTRADVVRRWVVSLAEWRKAQR
jgi:hypothetical protein